MSNTCSKAASGVERKLKSKYKIQVQSCRLGVSIILRGRILKDRARGHSWEYLSIRYKGAAAEERNKLKFKAAIEDESAPEARQKERLWSAKSKNSSFGILSLEPQYPVSHH